MHDTAFYLTLEQEARFARGHTMPPHARRFEQAPYQDLNSWNPCGMLASTASDVLALARLQWTPGFLLSEDTRDEMHRLHSMDTDAPPWTIGYGLGWRLYRFGDRIYAGHGGGYIGNRCQLLVSVPDRVAVALFSNGNQAVKVVSLAGDLLTQIVDALRPLPASSLSAAAVPPDWKPLFGTYAVRHWHQIRIEYGPAGLRIIPLPEGGSEIPLRPLGDGRFLILGGRNVGEPLSILSRTPDGRAAELSLGGVVYRRI